MLRTIIACILSLLVVFSPGPLSAEPIANQDDAALQPYYVSPDGKTAYYDLGEEYLSLSTDGGQQSRANPIVYCETKLRTTLLPGRKCLVDLVVRMTAEDPTQVIKGAAGTYSIEDVTAGGSYTQSFNQTVLVPFPSITVYVDGTSEWPSGNRVLVQWNYHPLMVSGASVSYVRGSQSIQLPG